MSREDISIENVVGTGKIKGENSELNVEAIKEDLNWNTWFGSEGPHPGLNARRGEETPLVTFYSSGKFIVRADTRDAVHSEFDEVRDRLTEIGAIDEDTEVEFEINNLVCVADMGKKMNLGALSIALPDLSNVTYDSEMFPAVVYRDDETGCTFLIFSSGKVVIPGQRDFESVKKGYSHLLEVLDEVGMV